MEIEEKVELSAQEPVNGVKTDSATNTLDESPKTELGNDGKEHGETETGSQTDASNFQNEEFLRKQLESEVSHLKKCNADLETRLDQMSGMLKNSGIEKFETTKSEEVDEGANKLPVDEFNTKAEEEGAASGSSGTSGSPAENRRESTSSSSSADAGTHVDVSNLYSHGDSLKVSEYETQIETLTIDMEILRDTLHEAYEREQIYKSLVEQLDNAEAKAQQKWSAFHNAVVQQWSNHCNFLQRQLGFVSTKLRQATEQNKSDGSDGSLTSSSADNLESNYGNDQLQQQDQQQDQQQQQQQQPPPPHVPVPIIPLAIPQTQTSTDTTPGTHAAMLTGMVPFQMPPIPVPQGQQPPPPPPWIPQDNQRIPPNLPPRQPPGHPEDFLEVDPNACAGRVSSARRLHRFFANMSMIEQAQREGRAYPQRVYDEEEEDEEENDDSDNDDVLQINDDFLPIAHAAGHAPRRARAFGSSGFSDGIHQEREEYAQSEQNDVHSDQEQLQDRRTVSSYTLTPTADPFVPQATKHIG